MQEHLLYNTWVVPNDFKKQIISVMNTSFLGGGGNNTATLLINKDNPYFK